MTWRGCVLPPQYRALCCFGLLVGIGAGCGVLQRLPVQILPQDYEGDEYGPYQSARVVDVISEAKKAGK